MKMLQGILVRQDDNNWLSTTSDFAQYSKESQITYVWNKFVLHRRFSI